MYAAHIRRPKNHVELFKRTQSTKTARADRMRVLVRNRFENKFMIYAT